jgi:hypothetical protein
MAHPRITLKQLYRRARNDRKLLARVLKDPQKAVEGIGRSLTPGDLAKVRKALNKVYKIKGKQLAEMIIDSKEAIRPWPQIRPWPILFNRPWP